MTIDEIIEQMDEIAVYQEFEYGKETFEMYMQVIDLLKELKLLREKLPQGHTSWDKGYDARYNNGIDNFAYEMKHTENCYYCYDEPMELCDENCDKCLKRYQKEIDDIAERLKG